MSIVDVKEGWSKRSGNQSSTAGIRLRRHFTVLTDDATDTPLIIIQDAPASGLPKIGDVYPTTFLRCTAVTPKAIGPLLWDVACDYVTATSDPDELDPLMQPPVFEWRDGGTNEAVDLDANQNPVVNTVEEPFDPPLSRDTDDMALVITRNEAFFDPVIGVQFRNVVNSDLFLSAPGQALMRSVTGRDVIEGGFSYAEVRYEIHFRRGIPAGSYTGPDSGSPPGEGIPNGGPSRAWYKRVLNSGTRKRGVDVEGQHVYEPILASDGSQITTPVPLSPLGNPLAASDAPYWLEFPWYESRPFACLQLFTIGGSPSGCFPSGDNT